jgi:RHS repeat-associated protein
VVTVDHTRGNQVALRWLLYDGHGNLVRLMAPDYTLSAFQWRGVWGEVQGSLGTGRGYCANLGHPEDETGLVYMRARYYEPATGRFISEDPSRDGVNWYLYADGNPVNKADIEGKVAGWIAVLLIGISFGIEFYFGFIAGWNSVADYLIGDADPAFPRLSPSLGTGTGNSVGSGLGAYFFRGAQYGRGIGWISLIRSVGIAGAVGFIIGFELGVIAAMLDFIAEYPEAVVEVLAETGRAGTPAGHYNWR